MRNMINALVVAFAVVGGGLMVPNDANAQAPNQPGQMGGLLQAVTDLETQVIQNTSAIQTIETTLYAVDCGPGTQYQGGVCVPLSPNCVAIADGQDYSGLDLQGCDFSNTSFVESHFVGANLTGAKIVTVNWQTMVARDANFSSADMRGAFIEEAFFQNANFRDADLTDATFYDVNLTGADFTGANLIGVTWEYVICPDGTSYLNTKTCLGHL